MALLSCNRWSRISRGVLEKEPFVPTCNIIISGFFFKIGIKCWLIIAKVAPLKSCTFTKRFLLRIFSSIPVIIKSPTITQVLAGHVCLISLGEASFIVQFSLETSLLAADAFVVCVVSYLFINFCEACGNACTVPFIFNYQLYRSVSSRW